MASTSTSRWAIGIDMGGTFIDVVAVADDGRLVSLKHPRQAGSPAGSVLAAVDRVCAEHSIAASQVARIVHGSTVVTNLLLEQDAPAIAVLTTAGMGDVLALARQERRELYQPVIARPTPDARLFPAHLRFEIGGRIDSQGHETTPLDVGRFAAIAGAIEATGVAAVAVCLLFAHRNPAHEQRLRNLLAVRLPGVRVSISSEVDPKPREFERFLTTALDAYAKPLVADYLSRLALDLVARGLPEPWLMRSEGGIGDWRDLAARPISLAMSGPCAALEGVAASLGGRAEAAPVVVVLDVGGTSTDIGFVEHGRPAFGDAVQVGELRLRLRCADVESLSVGGGSLVRALPGGALRLGPRSQGASPGPAAYGLGGDRATLTDALCVLGRLPAHLAGGVPLDAAAAREALLCDLARPLGIAVQDAALAVVRTAASAMAEALKMRCFQRGHDPADSLLVAVGGGGAQHAAEVAELAGMAQVRVLPQAGVVAALGLLCALPARTAEQAVDMPLEAAALQMLDGQAAGWLAEAPETAVHWTLTLCHAGQDFGIDVPWSPAVDSVDALTARFEARHTQLRGNLPVRQALRVRQFRAVFEAARPQPEPFAHAGCRPAAVPGAWAGLPERGDGPTSLFAPMTTVWVPRGWRWERLPDDSLLLTRSEEAAA